MKGMKTTALLGVVLLGAAGCSDQPGETPGGDEMARQAEDKALPAGPSVASPPNAAASRPEPASPAPASQPEPASSAAVPEPALAPAASSPQPPSRSEPPAPAEDLRTQLRQHGWQEVRQPDGSVVLLPPGKTAPAD